MSTVGCQVGRSERRKIKGQGEIEELLRSINPFRDTRVGLILRAMGFDNSTRIYLAAGEIFGGKRFMKPFRSMFPRLENHSTVDPSEDLVGNTRGLLGSAVDYMVCLLSDVFMPTYDGPSNFANNLLYLSIGKMGKWLVLKKLLGV
ncbi:hypothetical protein RHGRI_003864 [Rhododendron griersonianum]|uniref:O-fucosyltransferase family protein n=1 Tax=Rhododendron griersonianum TaxID=479676 RepID=A0AAV6L7P9_9ERIC|nr:hypothetical protein RHGRI_003864 [Rhododendron griersonianum]